MTKKVERPNISQFGERFCQNRNIFVTQPLLIHQSIPTSGPPGQAPRAPHPVVKWKKRFRVYFSCLAPSGSTPFAVDYSVRHWSLLPVVIFHLSPTPRHLASPPVVLLPNDSSPPPTPQNFSHSPQLPLYPQAPRPASCHLPRPPTNILVDLRIHAPSSCKPCAGWGHGEPGRGLWWKQQREGWLRKGQEPDVVSLPSSTLRRWWDVPTPIVAPVQWLEFLSASPNLHPSR
jgi:hypothetical protein